MFTIRASAMRVSRPQALARLGKPRTFAGSAEERASKERSVQQVWLGDKGAWPVIGIIGFALGLCTYWGLATLATNPDVRISKEGRKATLRSGKSANAEEEE
ncbi:hypothetical protein JKP88DRAFT_222758 [Tribonema minus]|uniref:Uncharacterized protein n=1 Tax=Tribonema minus TaxID=303371 RepID=A0A836CCP5_9STRA|nr:hypothetical protein JKP88DRAFT_222758 [Tribonema minus]